MARHLAATVETIADDHHLEVGLGIRGNAVHVTLVDHVQQRWLELLTELLLDLLLHVHG